MVWLQPGGSLSKRILQRPHNRVDVLLERADYPLAGHKVSLEFCFRSVFPVVKDLAGHKVSLEFCFRSVFPVVKEFGQASFRVTQEYLDGGKARNHLLSDFPP
jgi:hypothetical protein